MISVFTGGKKTKVINAGILLCAIFFGQYGDYGKALFLVKEPVNKYWRKGSPLDTD